MACQYWYEGRFRSEEEFKSILNNGLIDTLLKGGKLNIPELEANEEQIKKFNSRTKRTPITVRIRHKIQQQINNERVPNTGGKEFVNKNPLDVIKKAVAEGGANFEFKMVIKVGGQLQTGEGKINGLFKQELEESPVGIKEHLKEGIPYMLIPSSYGWYPIQLKSHTIKDSKISSNVKGLIEDLSKATTNADITALKKVLEKLLYRTTIDFSNGKFIVEQFDSRINGNTTKTFNTVAEANDFIQSQLIRIDYTKINKGEYNTEVANQGAVSTDLFSENGNFFNSSSFVLEAYQMSESTLEELREVFDFTFDPKNAESTNVSEAEANIPNAGSTANKSAESPIFEAPIDELNNIVEFTVVKSYPIPNSNSFVEVTAVDRNGRFTVVSSRNYTLERRQNANDVKIYRSNNNTGKDAELANRLFYDDSTNTPQSPNFLTQVEAIDVKSPNALEQLSDLQERVRQSPPLSFMEGINIQNAIDSKRTDAIRLEDGISESDTATPVAAPSIIQRAAGSALASLATEQEGPQIPDQDLSDLLATAVVTSTETIPEDPIGTDPNMLPESLFGENMFTDDFDREDPNSAFRSIPKVDGTTWNQKEELEELQRMMGRSYARGARTKGTIKLFKDVESLQHYLPRETYAMLLEARKQGKEVHGVFTRAAVYLSQHAEIGTGYHEAFHVVFTLALPLKTRIKLLNDTYEKYKSEFPLREITNKDGSISYRMPTYNELEEFLADKFMDYKLANEKVDGILPDSMAKNFKGLYRMLKVFFVPNAPVDIDTLFESINLGVYRNAIKFTNTRLTASTRLRAEASKEETAPDRRYENPLEEEDAFEYMQTVMDEVLNAFAKTENLTGLTDKELIQKVGVHKMYSLILKRLSDEYVYNKNKGKVEAAQRLFKLYSILTNNGKVISTMKVGEQIIPQFKQATDLLTKFNYDLRKRGIYINYSGVKQTNDPGEDRQFQEEDPFNNYNAGEETFEEAWMRGHIEINPMESVSQRLKSFFATIPKYKSNRKNAGKVINTFGVVKKENPSEIFKKLIAQISNSYSMSEMMQKLNNLNAEYPYIKHILEKIEQDPILKTELWANIASKNFATFSFVYEKNGEYSVVNSNRKTLDAIIKEELIANFLKPDNKMFLKENGQTNYEMIDAEVAGKFQRGMAAVLNFAKTNGATLSKNEILELFSRVSNELKQYKINIEPDDFNTIWNPESGNASWNNVLNLLETFKVLADQLVTGENPFLFAKPSEQVNREVSKKGKSLVEQLARQLLPALDREIVSSFRNIEGKTVYNLILSGFIDKQMSKFKDEDKLKAYLEEIKEDPLMSKLPFIQDLLNDDFDLQSKLDTVLLDGLARKGKNRTVSYGDMSDIEIEATSIGMYWNGGAAVGASKASFFKLPIPSNATTIAYIKSINFSREEIIDRLVKTAEAEFGRIQNLKAQKKNSRLRRIVNFGKNGEKFQILNFLEGKIDTSKAFDAQEVRQEIESFLNDDITKSPFFQKEIAEFKRKGVITTINEQTGQLFFAETLMDSRIKNQTAFFKDYLLNTYYMNTQMTTLLGGDPSFYKNTVNYQKRYKQVVSPGMYSNTEEQRTFYNAVIMKDSIVASGKEFVDHAIDIIDKANMPESQKKTLKAFWSAKTNVENGNNETDGTTLITIERRKETMEALGRWTPEHDLAMARVKAGTETIEDLMLINPPFKPEKPFVFTHRIEDGVVVPTQVKNAETVLTRSFALKKDSSGKLLYPKLAAMFQDMEEGKFDTAIFESAMKEGAIVNLSGEFSDYVEQPDGSYKLVEDAEIIQLKTEDWRLQQETPPHYVDERGNFGTQLRNLIIGDLNFEGDYDVNGQTLKGKEVARLYQELVVEDLRTSFEDVRDMFENPDGTINYTRLAAELRKEVIERELGQDYLDALKPIQSAIEGTTTALPLYHPLISYKMEAVMNSFFKNRVTKQKIAGGAFINTTSFGVSEHLKIKIDPVTSGITYEAMLPAWSKQFFPKDKNGEVDIETLRSNPKSAELLRIIGYRIPTEDKYSMFNIEVVGFTPPAMGGTVILPIEVTTMAGLDFDIDKLYFMARAFKKNAEGTPEVIKYIESIDNPQQAKDLAINIFASVNDFARFVRRNITDREEQERYINIHTELLDKEMEAQTAAFKQENAEIYEDLAQVKILIEAAKKKSNKVELAIHQETKRQYYEVLREQFVPFSQSTGMVDPKSSQLVEFIEKRLIEKFDPISFNTKQARDNKKLDIMQGILENKNTTPSILSVGNFDNLKESAARIRLFQAGRAKDAKTLTGTALTKAADELDNADFNINYPSTQLELFRRNMTGNQLIGIFANHNTHHAKAQFTNLRLKEPIMLNGQSYFMLNQQRNSQGKLISKSLASGLAAVVDNASEPISSFINLNTFTTNTAALLMRAGVEEDTIWALLNQPVILELTQRYFNERGSLSDEKNFTMIKNKWKGLLEEKLKGTDVTTEDILKIPLTQELLENNLTPLGTEEYYAVQYAVLNAFDTFYKTANELNQGVQASRIDTVGVGPTTSSNFILLQKQTRVLAKIEKKDNLIEGAEEVFLQGSADQVMIPGFTKYGLHGPLNILNKIFPSIGQITESGDIMYSAIGSLKEYFAGQKSSGLLSEREVRLLDVHFMDFIGSAFPFFNYSQSKDILSTMPDRLQDFRDKTPKDAPYRKLLDQLYVVDANNYSDIKRIEYYTTGKRPEDTQRIKAAWERMLIDPNPEVKEMAWDLIKYTFFANGYGFGPHSFANLVPVLFWTNEYQIKEGIVDKSNRPFNDFLASALKSDQLAKTETAWKNRFINQFIRNNGTKEGFVKTVKLDNKIFDANDLLEDVNKLNSSMGKAAREAMGGIIKTNFRGYVAVNQSKNTDLQTTNRTPARFIKTSLGKGKFQLYELEDTKEFSDAPWANMAIYKPISNLGISNFMLEYDFTKDIENSHIASIKQSANPAVKQGSTMEDIEAQIMAEAQASMMADMDASFMNEIMNENPALTTMGAAFKARFDGVEGPATGTSIQPAGTVLEGVQELFDSNPELAKLGTVEQYSRYLSTIFPNSKLKDILYHGSDRQINEFNTRHNDAGTHFGTLQAAKDRSSKHDVDYKDWIIHTVLINANSIYNQKDDLGTTGDSDLFYNLYENKLISEQELIEINEYIDANIAGDSQAISLEYQSILERLKFDSVEYINRFEDKGSTSYIVFEPEQIHILGSKQDVEGFRNFVSGKAQPAPTQTAAPTKDSGVSFLRQNADMSDTTNLEAATQSALTETPVTFSEYQKEFKNYLDRRTAASEVIEALTAEEFVSLSTPEKNTLIWQLKNCK